MSNKEHDKCQFPKCVAASDLIYIDKGLCDEHWTLIADMKIETAYKKLGIKKQIKQR